MDDLTAKLNEILADPESMKQVQLMAQQLLGEERSDEKPSVAPEPQLFEGLDIGKIATVLTKYKSASGDPRTALLLALKPNLSAERQAKVDTAIKLLKMIELLPLLKDSGLLNL